MGMSETESLMGGESGFLRRKDGAFGDDINRRRRHFDYDDDDDEFIR